MIFYLQVLGLVTAGVILLWIGYSLFFGPYAPFYPFFLKRFAPKSFRYKPGHPQFCPVCSTKLKRGELVKSTAFPSLSGGRDRTMYINGCRHCINSDTYRKCPICGAALAIEDFLVTRMFERPNRRNHVHVLGCNHCKKSKMFMR